jgi:hypothetical protein
LHRSRRADDLLPSRQVRCCVSVRQLTEGKPILSAESKLADPLTPSAFKRADHDNDGWVNLGYEQFMDIVRSCVALLPVSRLG